jgi:hypothetical protein
MKFDDGAVFGVRKQNIYFILLYIEKALHIRIASAELASQRDVPTFAMITFAMSFACVRNFAVLSGYNAQRLTIELLMLLLASAASFRSTVNSPETSADTAAILLAKWRMARSRPHLECIKCKWHVMKTRGK